MRLSLASTAVALLLSLCAATARADTQQDYLPAASQAIKAMNSGDYEAAFDNLNKCIKSGKFTGVDQSMLLNYRGAVYFKRKDYAHAIEDFKAAVASDPGNESAQANLADAQKAAANAGSRVASKDPVEEAKAGLASQEEGDNESAIWHYTNAIKMGGLSDKFLATAYNNRGNALCDTGEPGKAIADYSEAIRINPEYANAYNGRGNAWYDKGDADKALADYERALKVAPDMAIAHNGRGNALQDKGDLKGALAAYGEALKFDPQYPEAFNGRGSTKSKLKDWDGAIADYTDAIKLRGNYAKAYAGRGEAKKAKGDKKGAAADLKVAKELAKEGGGTAGSTTTTTTTASGGNGTAPPPPSQGTGRTNIISTMNGKCMDVTEGKLAVGTILQVWDCGVGNQNQMFEFIGSDIKAGGFCLDAFAGKGERIALNQCVGSPNQKWSLADGHLKGMNNLCIGIGAANPNNGAQLVLWDCTGGPEQNWKQSAVMVAEAAGKNVGATLGAPHSLKPGERLLSADGRFDVALQSNGDLVLTKGPERTVLWSSGTAGKGATVATMQDDGNFVLYKPDGTPVWATNTWKSGSVRATMQNDGNFVLYKADGKPTWATNTCCY